MRIYLITLFLFIYFTVQCSDSLGQTQDSTYQWARLSNIENKFRSLGIRTNFNNDIFSFCWYIDSIYIEDTAFLHFGGYPNHQDFNVAIVKRDYQGNFIKACDFFTPQNKSIWFVDVEIDKESNLLVFGSFSDTPYIDNKRITVSDNQGRNLFLVKLDSDFNFIWGNTISSPYQDECGNINISEDNYYYLTANHMHNGSDTVSRIAYYLGQDSAYVDDGLNSLLKIDKDGMIIWRKEIHDDNRGHSDGRNTVVGQDNNIYIVGSSTTDIIIEGDTLNHPTYPDYCNCGYIVQFDPEGGHHNSLFLDTHLNTYYYQLEVDHNSDYYLSGIFYQSLILGNDTIYLTGDTTGYIILKMDSSSQLKWYECIKVNTSSSQVSPKFKIGI